MVQIRLIMLVESRIRGDVYVRFGGEFVKTYHSNMERHWVLSLLRETVKIYEQGKKYYDALRSVHNLVRDARKVQQSIIMVGEIGDIYINTFRQMLADENYSPEELSAIAFGYAKLLEQGSFLLDDLKQVVTVTGLQMSDRERMESIDKIYEDVRQYRDLTAYYTRKNISVSYLRSKQKGDLARIRALYGSHEDRYW